MKPLVNSWSIWGLARSHWMQYLCSLKTPYGLLMLLNKVIRLLSSYCSNRSVLRCFTSQDFFTASYGIGRHYDFSKVHTKYPWGILKYFYIASHSSIELASPYSIISNLKQGIAFVCIISHSPLTLFICTQPPAAVIRADSCSLDGLWSYDSLCTAPHTLAIARESPTFACQAEMS